LMPKVRSPKQPQPVAAADLKQTKLVFSAVMKTPFERFSSKPVADGSLTEESYEPVIQKDPTIKTIRF